MRKKVADKLAKISLNLAFFAGHETASWFYTKQPKEPKSIRSLNKQNIKKQK